jgi:hypothetical protein
LVERIRADAAFDALLQLVRDDFCGSEGTGGCYGDDLLRQIDSHNLASMAHRSSGGPGGISQRLTERHGEFAAAAERMEQGTRGIARAAEERGLRCAVIKGLALNGCIYGDALMRECGDIDLLIRGEDASAFHGLLLGQGLAQRRGQTSFGSKRDSYSVARLAAYADRPGLPRGASAHPTRSNLGKKEYGPYARPQTPTVELHYGFHCLDGENVLSREDDKGGAAAHGLVRLSTEVHFVVLPIIEHADDSLILTLVLPEAYQQKGDEILFQR